MPFCFLNALQLGFPTSKGFESLVGNFKVMPLDYVIVNIETHIVIFWYLQQINKI